MGIDDAAETVVGRQLAARYRYLYLAVVLASACWALAHRHHLNLFHLWILVSGTRLFRPPTRVTAAGVRRVGWRNRFVGWDDIAAVARPTSWATSVILVMRDDTMVSLSDLAAAESQRVAGIGGKELKPVLRTPPQPVMPVSKPRPSAEDTNRDLARRAATLAAEADRMTQELDRIRRRRVT